MIKISASGMKIVRNSGKRTVCCGSIWEKCDESMFHELKNERKKVFSEVAGAELKMYASKGR